MVAFPSKGKVHIICHDAVTYCSCTTDEVNQEVNEVYTVTSFDVDIVATPHVERERHLAYGEEAKELSDARIL